MCVSLMRGRYDGSFFEITTPHTKAMDQLTTCSEGRILRNASQKVKHTYLANSMPINSVPRPSKPEFLYCSKGGNKLWGGETFF